MNTVPTTGQPAPAPAAPQPAPAPPAAAASGLRSVLLVAAAMLLPLLIYLPTALSVRAIWDSSGTFAHGYVILPISLWLVWRQRAELLRIAAAPCWWALLPLAAISLLWLLAELVKVQVVAHYALAAMLPLAVLAVLGRQVARALAFPLLFVLFAVPFGEALLPPLINLTADMTVWALRLTGIPVLRDGNNFSIPSGNWSVVEACSGLRYLVSSITLGCLFAYLSYRSTWRRALFILASVIVPVLANGARAYLIVMIGHLSDMTLAVGVDHLIYGWLFFGVVMLLLFWIGSFWREDHLPHPAAAPAAPAAAPPLPWPALGGAALAVAAVLAASPAYAAWLEYRQRSVPPVRLEQFASPSKAAPALQDYQPQFAAPSATLQRSFELAKPVGLTVLYYRDQADGGKMISAVNRFGGHKSAFRENRVLPYEVALDGRRLRVREAQLGYEGHRLLVWQWYWIGGQLTSNDYVGKILQVKEKLTTGNGDGAVVMVYAPYDEDPAAARDALRGFLAANLGPLDVLLASNQRP